jgi:hypothetical protein
MVRFVPDKTRLVLVLNRGCSTLTPSKVSLEPHIRFAMKNSSGTPQFVRKGKGTIKNSNEKLRLLGIFLIRGQKT